METKEMRIPFGEYETYVRVVNPNGKNTPLLLLHGGPGSTHNSMELLDPLGELGDRPVISYDQLGCGLSSRPDDHPELYQASTWIEELENLRKQLHLSSLFLLGHSWGGMLEQLYLTSKRREGIRGVILSSTLCSASQWGEETLRLAKRLSQEDQKAIQEALEKKDFSSPSFLKANEDYLKLTVSDYDKEDPSTPECLRRKKNSGKVAYETAWGPCEFLPLGNLKDYDTREGLQNVTCPALLLYGGNDESTELQNETMFSSLGSKDKEIHCFAGARHMTYFEAKGEYLTVVSSFLSRRDPLLSC